MKIFLIISLFFLSINSLLALEKKAVCNEALEKVQRACRELPQCSDIESCIDRRNTCNQGFNDRRKCEKLNDCMVQKFPNSCIYYWMGSKCSNQTTPYMLAGCPGSNAIWAPFSDSKFDCSGNKRFYNRRREQCDKALINYRDKLCVNQKSYTKLKNGLGLNAICDAMRKTVNSSNDNKDLDGSTRTDDSSRKGKPGIDTSNHGQVGSETKSTTR